MATDLELVSHAYRELLQLPQGSARLNLQPALAMLRDEIAYMTGNFPEDVQNAFELWAGAVSSIDKIVT